MVIKKSIVENNILIYYDFSRLPRKRTRDSRVAKLPIRNAVLILCLKVLKYYYINLPYIFTFITKN